MEPIEFTRRYVVYVQLTKDAAEEILASPAGRRLALLIPSFHDAMINVIRDCDRQIETNSGNAPSTPECNGANDVAVNATSATSDERGANGGGDPEKKSQ